MVDLWLLHIVLVWRTFEQSFYKDLLIDERDIERTRKVHGQTNGQRDDTIRPVFDGRVKIKIKPQYFIGESQRDHARKVLYITYCLFSKWENQNKIY